MAKPRLSLNQINSVLLRILLISKWRQFKIWTRTTIDGNKQSRPVIVVFLKGLPIKDVRSQGGFVQCGQFAYKEDSSDADVRTFWCKKLRIFQNLWCVRTDSARKVEQLRTFCGQRGRRVKFSRFRADIFYGRPLTGLLLYPMIKQTWLFQKAVVT